VVHITEVLEEEEEAEEVFHSISNPFPLRLNRFKNLRNNSLPKNFKKYHYGFNKEKRIGLQNKELNKKSKVKISKKKSA
jgi:hypothetical protein